MKRINSLACVIFIFGLTGCDGGTSTNSSGNDSRSQGKGAPAGGGSKLVGTWEFVKSSSGQRPNWGTKFIFEPDGKVLLRGDGYANEGTYSLNKDTLKIDAAALQDGFTVTKLTDSDLVLELHQPGQRPKFEYKRK